MIRTLIMKRLCGSMTLILVMPLLAACGLDPIDDQAWDDPYDAELPYREGFRRVNSAPFTTQLGSGSLIDVWVSARAAGEYSKVLLDGAGSNVSLPVGTVIVREVLDENREIKTLTLMIKNEPGYYPGGGDYWYGVADPDGTIRSDDAGNLLMGRLETCGSCHAARPNDDFLFGVPSAYH
jgi:hypothetical protein